MKMKVIVLCYHSFYSPTLDFIVITTVIIIGTLIHNIFCNLKNSHMKCFSVIHLSNLRREISFSFYSRL